LRFPASRYRAAAASRPTRTLSNADDRKVAPRQQLAWRILFNGAFGIVKKASKSDPLHRKMNQ
jgi:hypothetical protein